MKKTPTRLAATATLLIAALSAGCGPGGRIERLRDADAAAEASRKAHEAQRAGKIDAARSLYEDVAIARPSDPDAHLSLGILLHDLVGDPYAALAEYRAFLRLAPGSDREEMVRERIRGARDQIARRTADGDSADRPALPGSEEQQRRIAALEAEVEAARREAEAASADRDKAKSEVERLQREILSKDRQIDTLQRDGLAAAPPRGDLSLAVEESLPAGGPGAGAAAPGVPVIPATARTYKVRRGDTLSSVARKNYNDATRVKDIREANRAIIGPDDKLREGTTLVLPY